ncbi:hypothetical protein OIU91_04715 [Streptomyces sp. NBC_01456]|uniref:hypothetical protein n=1 Tax=unclassified Streptomyces TaxID=2593676 RepID=UPI002E33684A|nr:MULTISPECIES: hypothetical protein [unclassified Streptomyces]
MPHVPGSVDFKGSTLAVFTEELAQELLWAAEPGLRFSELYPSGEGMRASARCCLMQTQAVFRT